MTKFNRKSITAMFMALAMLMGVWFGAPQGIAAAQTDDTATPTPAATWLPNETETAVPSDTPTVVVTETGVVTPTDVATPTGVVETSTPQVTPTDVVPSPSPTASVGTLQGLLDYLNAFQLDPATVTAENTTAFDRAYLEGALAMNTSELQIMQLAVSRARNSEVRQMARMMLAMHQKDQAVLLQLVENVGGNTNPSLSRVALLPGTAEQTLGFNWIDLNVVFGNKVKSAPRERFDLTFLDVAIGAHGMIVDASQVARLNSTNTSIQALAQHVAQEAALHKMLMITARDRIFFNQNTPITFPAAPTFAPLPTTVAPTETVTVEPTGVLPTVPPIEEVDPSGSGLMP